MALFQSRDTYGEIERIACKIVDLVRDDGYRFKDIALLCGDENDYRHLIEAVFSEYEIPYFTDRINPFERPSYSNADFIFIQYS